LIASWFVLLSCSVAFADTERRYALADHGTILTNPGQEPVVPKALAMLKSMRREAKAP